MSQKPQMKEYKSMWVFLAENDRLNKQLEIIVDGENLESTWGKLSCVYFESGKFYDDGGYRFWNSREPFYLITDNNKIAVKQEYGALRLFMSTSFERPFKDKGESGKEVDYCLRKGRKYYAIIKEESHEYGPPDESGKRGRDSVIYIQISDKEFKNNGEPQPEQTPTVKGWIYS